MKAYVERETKYFKTIYEQSITGEYDVELPAGEYLVELVGAGGGWANSRWTTDTHYCHTFAGGSGSYFRGILKIQEGTYSVNVGIAGKGINHGTSTGSGEDGGATSFGDIVSAGGGFGGYAVYLNSSGYHAGYGGSVSVLDKTKITKIFASSAGNVGTHKNGTYTTGPVSVTGGLSVYDNTITGYGAGGGYPNEAVDGYCKIMQQTTAEDYEVKEEIVTYKLPREVDTKYFKNIFEQATAGEYSISLLSGYYIIELVGAGGGCAGCRWASKVGNGNTMQSGGSGAYFKGIIYIPEGIYSITVGTHGQNVTANANTLVTAESGGDTSFSSLIIAGGGQGGQAEFNTRIPGGGGTCTINTPVLDMIANVNGHKGNANGSAAYGFSTVAGGTSVYNYSSTGYGAGGGYPDEAVDGYCKIMQQVTEDDSTNSQIEYTYFSIGE